MSAYEFNLSRYAERLEAGGVPREQALVHAELTAEILRTLVTRDQLQEVLAAQEVRIEEFVSNQMNVKQAELKAYLAETQTSLVKWLFAAFGTQAAFIIAFLKLFP